MQRLLSSLTVTSLAAMFAVAFPGSVSASDGSTADPAQNATTGGTNAPAQNVPPVANGTTTSKVNVDGRGIILKGYDAVAYFKQGKPVEGSPDIKSTYLGATYLFASQADKATFDRDPEKYAPRYGAFCSYGVAYGVLADTEGPNAFLIYRGKLYICGNDGALKGFRSDIDSNIEKADVNWRRLSGP